LNDIYSVIKVYSENKSLQHLTIISSY